MICKYRDKILYGEIFSVIYAPTNLSLSLWERLGEGIYQISAHPPHPSSPSRERGSLLLMAEPLPLGAPTNLSLSLWERLGEGKKVETSHCGVSKRSIAIQSLSLWERLAEGMTKRRHNVTSLHKISPPHPSSPSRARGWFALAPSRERGWFAFDGGTSPSGNPNKLIPLPLETPANLSLSLWERLGEGILSNCHLRSAGFLRRAKRHSTLYSSKPPTKSPNEMEKLYSKSYKGVKNLTFYIRNDIVCRI